MKKFLLSLSALLMSASVFAADITDNFNGNWCPTTASTTEAEYTSPTTGLKYKMANVKGYNTNPNYLMIYQNGYFTVSLNQVCQQIIVKTGAGASKGAVVKLYVGETLLEQKALNNTNTNFTFAIPAANQAAGTVYKFINEGEKNVQFQTITYVEDASAVTPDPEPDPEPEATEVASIAAFLALDKGTEVKFTNPVTAVYQSGNYLYITDSSDSWLQIFGAVGQTYSNGDVIPAGIKGTKGDYNGCVQLGKPDATTFKAGTAGTAVEPTVITGDELAADRINEYVKMVGVTINAKAGTSFPATDGNADFKVYDRFNLGVQPAQGVTVIGFTNIFNSDLQIFPTEIASASGKEYTAAPKFSVAAGEVAEGTEVVLTCATEGAVIYYTLDATEPTTGSEVYSTPIVINDETTIKAFAVADGMEPSDVVTAVYTVKVANPNVASYVFTDDAGMKAAYPAFDRNNATADGANSMFEVMNETLYANGVTLTFAKTASAETDPTSPRLYLRPNDQQLRVYKNTDMTFTAPANNTIEKIVFTGNSNLKNLTASVGTWDNATKTLTLTTAAPAVTLTTASDASTAQIYTIDVFCTKAVTGVENITVADENAPVEYYNLQGVRVVNPENGIYIRRQGNTVTKVLVK